MTEFYRVAISPTDKKFNYDIFGATVLEVEVDTLTGEHKVT